MNGWSTERWTPDADSWKPDRAVDDVVLAVGAAPGEGVRIPAELVPSEYRTDGRLWVVAKVDREEVLRDWW